MAYRILNDVGGATNVQLSKCGKAMLVYSILNSQKRNLKFLNKSDENIDICLNAINEFKKHQISINMLKKEINHLENKYLTTKLNDLSIIYENFENQIANKYIDDTDLLSILAENIDKTDMFKDSIIYIDEFAGFTNQEYEIIKKLINIAKTVTITICADDVNFNSNPNTDIFYSNKITASKITDLIDDKEKIEKINLSKTKRFKTAELKHLEENLYTNKYQKYKDTPRNIKLFLAKNQYSEIENVAQNIVKKVRDEGCRYKDIAVITKNIDTYSSQIRAIFNQYEIPLFIDEKRDLNQNHVIQYILALLEIFNKNYSQEAVFNYIKTGFLNVNKEDIFKFENYCTKWGIKHNKWLKKFEYGLDKEEEKQEAERLEEIRKQIINPLEQLKKQICEEKTAENVCKYLYEFLINQNFETILQEKIETLQNAGLIDIANEYKESYKIFINILDEITVVFKNTPITFEKYVNILKIGFKNSGLGKIPQAADQVVVGDADRSRSHKVKTIFIIGLNDGMFPSVNKDEGFLNDTDREVLKNDGIELAKGTIDKMYEENFNIYKAFTTAEDCLYLSYSSSDSEGKSLRPSILISKIKRIFPNLQENSDIIKSKQEILTKVTTYNELINSISDLKNGKTIDQIWYNVYKYYQKSPEWKHKLEESLKGLYYTNTPGQISQKNIDNLYGNTLNASISKLEKYRRCPFSYHLQYGLRLKEKEQLKVKSIDTGTFMHETIDQFFVVLKENKMELANVTEENIKEIVNRIIEEKLSLNKNYIFVSTAKYKLLVSRLKRIIAKAIKYIIETLTQSEFEILGTEAEFGVNGQYAPINLKLEDGKKVEITGKIDRIDTAKNEDGKYLRIIDYKSSIKNVDLNEVYAGLQIQLLTYVDAVCKKEDAMAAGILYFNLLEQMVDKKIENPEEIEEQIKEKFKMKGLILADVKVVKMHDKNLVSGASKLVPAYIDKSGNLSKKTNGVTKEQFEDLQKYIYKTIKEISKEILSGKIELKPYYKKGNTACQYCEYKPICAFNVGLCNNEYNYINNESKEDILEKIHNQN